MIIYKNVFHFLSYTVCAYAANYAYRKFHWWIFHVQLIIKQTLNDKTGLLDVHLRNT